MTGGKNQVHRQKLQPADDAVLYRYVTIDKLIDFLVNARLSFTRLNLFEDKLEGITPEHLMLNMVSDRLAKTLAAPWLGDLADVVTFNMNPTRRNELRRHRKVFQRLNYANCWYVDTHESVAMWQLYSRRDSVAIRIPFIALVDEVENQRFALSSSRVEKLTYGSMHYFNFSEVDDLPEFIVNEDAQGFVKDRSFRHEHEFRLMIALKDEEVQKAEPKKFILDEQIEEVNERLDLKTLHLRLDNFSLLPFEIVFHPQCSDWHRSNVTSIVKKFALPFLLKESALKRMFKD